MKYFENLRSLLLKLSLVIVAAVLALPLSAAENEEGGVDVKEIVLGHMSDDYDWHIELYVSAERFCFVLYSSKECNSKILESCRFRALSIAIIP